MHLSDEKIDSKGKNDFEVTKVLKPNLPSGLIRSSDNGSVMEGVMCLWACDVWVYVCVHVPVWMQMHVYHSTHEEVNLTTSSVSPHISPCLRQGLLVFRCLGQVYGLMNSWNSHLYLPSPSRSVLGSQMFFVCVQFLCRFLSFKLKFWHVANTLSTKSFHTVYNGVCFKSHRPRVIEIVRVSMGLSFQFLSSFVLFETRSHSVSQATVMLLWQPPEC